jgi:hypothetical protein
MVRVGEDGRVGANGPSLWDYPAMTDPGVPRRHRRGRSRGSARGLAAVLLSVLLAACGNATITAGPTTATPSPTLATASAGPSATPEDPLAVYARIEQQVQQIRGLTATTVVTPQILDSAGVAKELNARFDEGNPAGTLASEQQVYEALGLLPTGISLRDELFKLLTSQVAGFYEPDTKKMFVVSKTGAIGPAEKVTFAHEFDHALQDQHFDLSKLGTDEAGQSDRSLARLSVAEGDATLLMTDWLQQELSPADMLAMIGQSLDPTQTAILNGMPPFLRDQLMFPYTTGLSFTQAIFATGGWKAVDGEYVTPPDSTEQVIHPSAYLSHAKPLTVTIPTDIATRLGKGWTAPFQDTAGEFTLGEWLKVAGGVDETVASDAATGWGGDRMVLVEGPSGAWGVAIVTKWDTSADADEFAAAAQGAVGKLAHADLFRPVEGEVSIVIGSNDDIRARLANVLGFAG